MRNRKSASRDLLKINADTFELEDNKHTHSTYALSSYFGILFLLGVLAHFQLIIFIDGQLPTPLRIHDESQHPDRFIAERAQIDVKHLTDLGPRVVGSYENEVLAVGYLKKQITDIIYNAHKNQIIELDVQVVSGSYYLNTKPTGKINIYSNVQNVIVKLYGKTANHSLLLNAHFDSVPTSPGGSDDGINCATMLEVLRKFSKHEVPPQYSIIFLFNGAEESSLQASHGFITKHKWAKESRIVINLEAAGGGGKIQMFQTGPNRPWLNEVYSKVPHPYGQVASEELFQANVIPSDTDFRIFRDFGNMVGIDMAFVRDGYRYHTKFDGFDNIELGSYQQVGDNVMSLVQNIANNYELENANPKMGNVVFFDFLGGIFVSYSTSTTFMLSVGTFVASLFTFFMSLRSFNLVVSINTTFYALQILAVTLFGWLLASLSVIFLAFVLDLSGYSMSWYGHPWLIIGIFAVPTVICSTPMLLLIKPMHVSQNTNSFIQAQIIRIIWSSVMVIATLFGVRSIYPILLVVLFDTICYIVILLLRLQHSVWRWKIIYICFSIIPTSFSLSLCLELFGFFVPLCGRIGSNKMPDVFIGFATVFLTLLTLSPYYFLISLMRKPATFYKILTFIFVVCFSIVFTPFGFPYSGDPQSPTPQRFWILHSQRVFHGEDGGIIKKDSGYFFLNMDRNSPRSVSQYVDEIKGTVNLQEDCENFLLCGLPLAHQKMSEIVKYSTWIPAPTPIFPESTSIKVNSKKWLSKTILQYNITIFGPDHIMFYLSPKRGIKLIKMNFLEKMEERESLWKDRPYYFFVHTCGKELVPLNAIFDFSVPENHTGPVMDIAVAGNYVHSKKFIMSPHFQKFLSKFPNWADVTAWIANYQSWII